MKTHPEVGETGKTAEGLKLRLSSFSRKIFFFPSSSFSAHSIKKSESSFLAFFNRFLSYTRRRPRRDAAEGKCRVSESGFRPSSAKSLKTMRKKEEEGGEKSSPLALSSFALSALSPPWGERERRYHTWASSSSSSSDAAKGATTKEMEEKELRNLI